MKELTIEQKAKAYDKAIERANYILKGYNPKESSKTINYIFPELKESWGEMIRKEMIDFLQETIDNVGEAPNTWTMQKAKEWIAWLEKQKPTDREYTFKAIPRLLEMIEPTDRAKSYCQKLIDSLIKEGYVIDAMIVGEYLKQMNGEDVPMATMDEQKPYGQRKECLDCQFNYAGECKGSCQMKRNEQNSVDKVKLKFKVGDWIVNNISKDVFLIKSTNNGYYTLEDIKGNIISPCLPPCEDATHPWTIEDAKDGDVLCAKYGNDEMPFIFTGKQDDVAYCALNSFGEFVLSIAKWLLKTSVLPATKEQRDTLMKAMTNAGYEWDSDKKELKLLITNGGDITGEPDNKIEPSDEFAGLTDFERTLADICIGWIGEELGWKQYIKDNADALLKIAIEKFNSVQDTSFEQKSAEWREEDEDMIRYIGNAITCKESTKYLEEKGVDMIKAHRWLESRKSQFKQEWSKEDIDIINGIIIDYEGEIENLSNSTIDEQAKPIYQERINFLNKLKSLYLVKQEWNEENEQNLNVCLGYIPDEFLKRWLTNIIHVKHDKTAWNEEDEGKFRDVIRLIEQGAPVQSIRDHYTIWLKSIKQRYTWKPSEEQMHLLSWIANVKLGDSVVEQEISKHLNELYEDLKKL